MSLILSGTDGLSDVDGSAATPAIRGTDANTGIFFPAADTIAFSEGGVESMRIDSSGNVGIGTTLSPSASSSGASKSLVIATGSTGNGILQLTKTSATAGGCAISNDTGAGMIFYTHTGTVGSESYAERMRITSAGLVGIGTSSPTSPLTMANNSRFAALNTSGADVSLAIVNGSNDVFIGDDSVNTNALTVRSRGNMLFQVNTAERMRITSSGNVLVGSSSSYAGQTQSWGAVTANAATPNFAAIDTTAVASGVGGELAFIGQFQSNEYAYMGSIRGIKENGTSGNTACALTFSTRPNATAPTERMRITSGGELLVGKTALDFGTAGFRVDSDGGCLITRNGSAALSINRLTNDGDLVEFFQATTKEGSISVSGTTVSYNGGHLSRWSQLPNNQKDNTLLKGTVMSNLDDMCVWVKDGETLPNEQLNKMKVSDVEGDTNVAGVFVNWTFDEQCQSDDMNVAMTGDMIIRIAEGVVVQKGDLLMSAGDGTAMPQGDDIVRSKTIAKVTSNHVTCTYADGSYCVPCVLMAC